MPKYQPTQLKRFPTHGVTRNGHVYNLKTGRRLKPFKGDRTGHLAVDLPGKRMYVHTLVAEAFIGPRPPGMDICHGDNDPTNNHVRNLRYDTRSANMIDLRKRHPTCPHGHAFTKENTIITNRGWRRCRTCKNINRRKPDYDHEQLHIFDS